MRHVPDTLMLFAAGFGTRMAPLTETRPKPLIPVAGKALIDHALAVADPMGLRRIVVNLHYRGEQIRAHLGTRPNICFSDETETILDTGGGLRAALPLLGAGPVFTLNSDYVWTGPNPLQRLADAWDPARMDGLLLLVPPAQARGHAGPGDFLCDAGGRLTRGPGLVYGGAQILKTEGLGDFTERAFSLNLLWNRMMQQERLFGVVHQGGWCDVGHPAAIPLAEEMLRQVPHV